MQETSALYRQILATEPHWFETSVVIGESGDLVTEYGDKILFGGTAIIVSRDSPDSGYREERLMSVRTSIQMFNDGIEIGKAISQEIEVTMLKPSTDFPNMALVAPYVRVCSENASSEWIKQGVFYIDTRSFSDNDSESGLVTLTFHGYDAMLMTEQYYTDTGNLDWSSGTVEDTDMVSDIARIIGVGVDERTWDVMTSGYRVPLPTSYTLREVLGYLASMYVGCFIMTEEGLLRLVSVLELPPETNYLIDNIGDAITFGIDRQGSEVTVSGGAVASFETEGVCEISELIATIEPQQDLHGYDAPWPAGGKGNLFPFQDKTVEYNGTTAVFSNNHVKLTGTATVSGGRNNLTTGNFFLKAGTYYYKRFNVSLSGQRQPALYVQNGINIMSPINDGTFTLDEDSSTINIGMNVESGKTYNYEFDIMLVSGSTEPSAFYPYSNECPITGWTGVSGEVAGKNLLPAKFYSGMGYNGAVGTQYVLTELHDVTQNGNTFSRTVSSWNGFGMISERLPQGTYKCNIAFSCTSSRSTLYVLDSDMTITRRIGNLSIDDTWKSTITIGEGEAFIAVVILSSDAGTVSVTEPQIELGSTASPYEEYTSEVISVTFPTTVYGGTDELVSGNGISTMAKEAINISSIYAVSANPVCDFGVFSISNNFKAPLVYKGSATVKGNGGWSTTSAIGEVIVYSSDSNQLAVSVPKGSTLADAKALFDGTDALYELSTPQSFTHTGQEVDTLIGQNNVFVDTGNIEEVKYLIPTSEVTRILV